MASEELARHRAPVADPSFLTLRSSPFDSPRGSSGERSVLLFVSMRAKNRRCGEILGYCVRNWGGAGNDVRESSCRLFTFYFLSL